MTLEATGDAHSRFWSGTTGIALFSLLSVGFLNALKEFPTLFLMSAPFWTSFGNQDLVGEDVVALMELLADVSILTGLFCGMVLVVYAGFLSDRSGRFGLLRKSLLFAALAALMPLLVALIWGVVPPNQSYVIAQLVCVVILNFAYSFLYVAVLAVLFAGIHSRYFFLAAALALISVGLTSAFLAALTSSFIRSSIDGAPESGVGTLGFAYGAIFLFVVLNWFCSRRLRDGVGSKTLGNDAEVAQHVQVRVSVSSLILIGAAMIISGIAFWFVDALYKSNEFFVVTSTGNSSQTDTPQLVLFMSLSFLLLGISLFVALLLRRIPLNAKGVGFVSVVLIGMVCSLLLAGGESPGMYQLIAFMPTALVLAVMSQAVALSHADTRLLGLVIGLHLCIALLVRVLFGWTLALLDFSAVFLYASVGISLVVLSVLSLYWRHLLPAQWSRRDIQVYR